MGYLTSLFRQAAKRRTYANLLQLDDHLLRDIGLSRGELMLMAAGRRSERVTAHE